MNFRSRYFCCTEIKLILLICCSGHIAAGSCPCTDGKICDTTDQTCICDIGHYMASGDDSCLAAYGSACHTSRECLNRNLSNTVCTQGKCLCDLGFFYPDETHRTNCFEAFGSTCTGSEECEPILHSSVCAEGQCRCASGYYYVNSTVGCVPVHSSICAANKDCTMRGGDNYQCAANRSCSCGDNYYLSRQDCHPVAGSACTMHGECFRRGQGSHACDYQHRKCADPCERVSCQNNGTCVVDINTEIRGYRCLCTHPYAGLTCSHSQGSVVVTTLQVSLNVDTAGKKFFEWVNAGLVQAVRSGLCEASKVCNLQPSIEVVSIERRGESVDITYVVLEGQGHTARSRSSDEVVKILTSLSPVDMSRHLGYTISTPARGIIESEPAEYCKIRWAFQVTSQSITKGFVLDMELRLRSLTPLTLTQTEPIKCKVLNSTVINGVLRIVYVVLKDNQCLSAMSISKLMSTLEPAVVTPVMGLVPIGQPEVAFFDMNSRFYYQNAFVIKSRMPLTRTEAYFALHWRRLEDGLTRVITLALRDYLSRLGFVATRSEMRTRRRAYMSNGGVSSRLLDIRRVGTSKDVELVAYAQLDKAIIPIEHVLDYLNKTSADTVAKELREVIAMEGYAKAYDTAIARRSSSVGAGTGAVPCIKNSTGIRTMRYWTRTVMRIDPKTDVDTAMFKEGKKAHLTHFFQRGLDKEIRRKAAFPSTSSALPDICVQMVDIRRVSYDHGYTELVYYVTQDGSPVPATTLVQWASNFLLQDVALTLGESVDKDHIVEPYRHSLAANTVSNSAGKEFIVAFMENFVEANYPQANYSLRLYITTCKASVAQVTVEAPKMESGWHPVRVKLHPQEENFVVVPTQLMLKRTVIEPKVLLVTSDQPISVVAVNRLYLNQDSTLVLPVSQLGRDYTVASASSDGTQSQLAVAAYNDSIVKVELPRKGNGEYHRVTIGSTSYTGVVELRLRAMEVMQIQVPGDITGARVSSDNPVAVFSGNAAASISGHSRDHLYEQILPSASAGTGFIVGTPVVTGKLRHPDIVKVITSQADTLISVPAHNRTIRVEGSRSVVKIELTERDYSLYLYSNKPVNAFQLSQSARDGFGDPSLVQITPINQQASYHVLTVPASGYRNFLHYLTLHIESSHTGGLYMNGEPMQTPRYGWHTVLHTYPQISMLNLRLSPSTYRLSHMNSLVTFTAYLYGISLTESYSQRVGSCDVALVPKSLPSTTTRSTGTTPAAAPTERSTTAVTVGVPWPINEASKPDSKTAGPTVEWVTRLAKPLPYVKATNQKSATQVISAKPTNQRSARQTVSAKPTNQRSATQMVSAKPTNQNSVLQAVPAKPTNQKQVTTHLTSTVNSHILTTEVPTTTPKQTTPKIPLADEDHWLWFAAAIPQISLTPANVSYLERALERVYRGKSLGKARREVTSVAEPTVRVKIVRTEPYLNDTAIVFYVMEDGVAVNASLAAARMSHILTAELAALLAIAVILPISEYLPRPGEPNTVDELAVALPVPKKANDESPLWIPMLAVVGGLLALALLVGIVVHRQNEKKKSKGPATPAGDEETTAHQSEKEKEPATEETLPSQAQGLDGELGDGDYTHRGFDREAEGDVKETVKSSNAVGGSLSSQAVDGLGPHAAGGLGSHAAGGLGSQAASGAGSQSVSGPGPRAVSGPGPLAVGGLSSQAVGDPEVSEGPDTTVIEYPMSLSTAELDQVFAPYMLYGTTHNEIYRNKKLMRVKASRGSRHQKQELSLGDVLDPKTIGDVRRSKHSLRRSCMDVVMSPSGRRNDVGGQETGEASSAQPPDTDLPPAVCVTFAPNKQQDTGRLSAVLEETHSTEAPANDLPYVVIPAGSRSSSHEQTADASSTPPASANNAMDYGLSGNSSVGYGLSGNTSEDYDKLVRRSIYQNKKKYKLRRRLQKSQEMRSGSTAQPSCRLSHVSRPDANAAIIEGQMLADSSSSHSLPGSVMEETSTELRQLARRDGDIVQSNKKAALLKKSKRRLRQWELDALPSNELTQESLSAANAAIIEGQMLADSSSSHSLPGSVMEETSAELRQLARRSGDIVQSNREAALLEKSRRRLRRWENKYHR